MDGLRTLDKKEVIVTDPNTGGRKATRLQRYDLIPVRPLEFLASVYGKGARKYADRNWELGYKWSLSYAALQRHLNAFWSGEDLDNHLPECAPDCVNHTELPHLAQAAWHTFALMEFAATHPELDDRSKIG